MRVCVHPVDKVMTPSSCGPKARGPRGAVSAVPGVGNNEQTAAAEAAAFIYGMTSCAVQRYARACHADIFQHSPSNATYLLSGI